MFIISSQIVSFPTGSLYANVWSHVKYLLHLFCKPILMKIEMKKNEISSKVISKVKSQLSYPPLNLKRILEDN